MILVSACLLGTNCKYSGGNNKSERLAELVKDYTLLPVCPEVSGGMPTPRKPNEITGGSGEAVLMGSAKVQCKEGTDNTESFIKGAKETLSLAKKFNIKYAVLKERSPSCGSSFVYDGTFSGKLVNGRGVTAALLMENGIKVYSENGIEQLLKDIQKDSNSMKKDEV
ncbi:MAG: DUF523 domain-containing protein [Bacillota bacterium]|nr:DUF523 domain-containing protein [Bacillota bacterium]